MEENIDLLREEILKLKQTVDELQRGCVKVETDTAKLLRWKNEIIYEVLPKKVTEQASYNQISEFRTHVSTITNDLFFFKHEKRADRFSKMVSQLFGYEDSEERIADYLSIFRNTCEFMAAQYEGNWIKLVEVPSETTIEIRGRTYVRKGYKLTLVPLEE